MPIFLIAKDKNLRLIWVLSSATAISNRRWTKNLKMIHLLWWTWVSIMMMSSIKTVRIEIYIVGHAEFKKIGVYLISLTIILENLVKLLLINLKIILKKCTVQVFIPKAGTLMRGTWIPLRHQRALPLIVTRPKLVGGKLWHQSVRHFVCLFLLSGANPS